MDGFAFVSISNVESRTWDLVFVLKMSNRN